MIVLGINSYLHDTSAALIRDGKVVFAIEEERLSRLKKDARFPKLAIQAALEYGGVGFDDLDAIAFGWNRGGLTPLHTLRSTLTGRLPRSPQYVLDSVVTIGRELYHGNGRRALVRAGVDPAQTRVIFVDHHEAHAWSAYALSGFDDALVLVMDGRGAVQSTTLYHGREGRLRAVQSIPYPNSLGSFYEAFTDLLGFERHNDEWKVMGLAAYGQPRHGLEQVIRVVPGGYEVNTHLVCGRHWNDIRGLVDRFGPRRKPEVQITDADADLAASVQRMTEEAVFALVREGIRLTGSRRLCLAGGVAMNSKANGRLLASGLIEDIFVQPAATDDGTAIGAALGAFAKLGLPVPRYEMTDAYLGPDYDDEIAATLKTYKLTGTYVRDVEAVTAGLLAEGKIVGWFQGRMEFGPRALGNRSILADPRRVEMRDRVNESVKFREGWRPFAPSCLAEAAGEYFVGGRHAPFMILTFEVRPEKRAVIPAVTHADNSARVQTVTREANPRFHALIREFARLTGVPVVLNTSFNLKGEPIVCSPKDAIRTFYSSGLDFLVLGNFVVAKDPQWCPPAEGASTGAESETYARAVR
ncbi:MAG TPA: carbamoyltransferase [Chloroflexota bacterium]|nr:carbamoyltransferase [Chloroflexota bacterium]